MRTASLVRALALIGMLALPLSRAEATVCLPPPSWGLLLPSMATHVVSVGIGTVGVTVSKAGTGWRRAAIAISAVNLLQAGALLAYDAITASSSCGGPQIGPFSSMTLLAEGAAAVLTSGLLTTAIVWAAAKDGPPAARVFVAATPGGWRAGVSLAF